MALQSLPMPVLQDSSQPLPFAYRPPAGIPQVIFADESIVVVDKPSGLLSVPGRQPQHRDSALLRLQAAWGPLWVVHRLDMDTSGLIVYARSQSVAAHLGRQFERRRVGKIYEAVVWGRPPSSSGVIDLPLRLDWPHRPRQIVDPVGGKPSITQYSTQHVDDRHSRLRLHPLTGRSHQLRVHLSAIGLPIVGDRFYGLEALETLNSTTRLMLHARELEFEHPVGGEPVVLHSEPTF